jgi:hypothetical protein
MLNEPYEGLGTRILNRTPAPPSRRLFLVELAFWLELDRLRIENGQVGFLAL